VSFNLSAVYEITWKITDNMAHAYYMVVT